MKGKHAGQHAPRIVGTGLIALDVVYRDRGARPKQIATGGTCGNVLAILAYLGWRSVPLARFADDPACKRITADLARWEVDTSLLSIEPSTPTPIIIEHLTTADHGQTKHSFSWNCPCCGQWLPRYSPVPARSFVKLASELPDAEVFFFDRPSPGALKAAAHYATTGALIVFEPSAKGRPESFAQALELAHVVKYADERMERLPVPVSGLPRLILEIKTRGESGLQYRCMLPAQKKHGWRSMRAIKAPSILDTVGCGDWCTAGLLMRIGAAGVEGLRAMHASDIRAGLRYGQALAAWNCSFLGARGGMYERNATETARDVAAILDGRTTVLSSVAEPFNRRGSQTMSRLCATCGTNGERLARHPG